MSTSSKIPSVASRIVRGRCTSTTGSLSHQFQSVRCLSSNQPSESSGGILDYFFNFRRKTAESLTVNMSNDERKKVLQKLGAVDKKEADEEASKSIGEAIAAFKADETKKLASKWEKEKADITRMTEEAVRARIENEIEVQEKRMLHEKWQMQKQQMQMEKQQPRQQVPIEVKENSSGEQVAATDMETEVHPILGPVIADLGYKRLHLVTTKNLSTIKVWKKQRIYRHERAKVIAADKVKTPELGLPGVIMLHETNDGSLSIIDGQHRVGALTLLQRSESAGFDVDKILVEVFPAPANGRDNAQDLFVEVNKSEPVKLVDLPGVAKKADLNVINEGAQKLQDAFPDMFKPSQKCRPPHLNIDNLRDALFASNVLQKHKIATPQKLVDWLLAENDLMRSQIEENKEIADKMPQKALQKAKKFDFFLGLDSKWLYH